MKYAVMRLMLFSALVIAQNQSQRGNAPQSIMTDREAAIAKCFADAPNGSRHDAWLDKCLRDAR